MHSAATLCIERPIRPDDIELVGEMPDSGFVDRQWLARRRNTFVQLTEPLYRILEYADGTRSIDEIAACLSDTTDWTITPAQVRQLITLRLIPQGLISYDHAFRDAVQANAVKGSCTRDSSVSPPYPLMLQRRTRVLSERWIRPICVVLQVLYTPPLLIPLLVTVAAAHAWLYLVHGLNGAIVTTLYTPGQLPVAVAITACAAVVHEFGHAAALQYGGGRTQGMGIGVYLIYPVLYTDTTDCYRLSRTARLRTDLGGFYFYLLFCVGLIVVYYFTGREAVLIPVMLINLDIAYQLLPFVRMDGYWALADLTGLPDPMSYTAGYLRSLKGGEGRLPPLKPWVQRVFTLWLILSVPVLLGLLGLFLTRAPELFAMAWEAYFIQVEVLAAAVRRIDLVTTIQSVLHIFVLALMMLGIMLVFYDLTRKVFGLLQRYVWHRQAVA